MKASDVMTRRVIAIHDDASVEEAAQLMLQEGIAGLPVIGRGGTLIGMVTERDFLRRSGDGTCPRWLELMVNPASPVLDQAGRHRRSVSDVMTRGAVTVFEDADIESIAMLMELRDVSRVVVMRDETMVGIIGRSNLLHALATGPSTTTSRKESDLAIRREIISDLALLAWMPSASVNPIVWDGIVHWHGCVRHERERAALTFVARCIPGVVGVEDHLVLVRPRVGTLFRRSAGFAPERADYAGAA